MKNKRWGFPRNPVVTGDSANGPFSSGGFQALVGCGDRLIEQLGGRRLDARKIQEPNLRTQRINLQNVKADRRFPPDQDGRLIRTFATGTELIYYGQAHGDGREAALQRNRSNSRGITAKFWKSAKGGRLHVAHRRGDQNGGGNLPRQTSTEKH